jgi:hypothetical protein
VTIKTGHDLDLDFMAWLRAAPSPELVDCWTLLMETAWRPDLWKVIAIERELERRGEPEPSISSLPPPK